MSFEHTYGSSGKYQVRVEAYNGGCYAQRVEEVSAHDLFVSNAITPDGDGQNDHLVVISEEKHPLTIYDRSGAAVYSSTSYANDWSGEHLSSGVYFYDLELSSETHCKGWVHLIKAE